MLNALDHIVLVVRDLDKIVARYCALFNCDTQWRANSKVGTHAWLQLGNIAVDIVSPKTGSALDTHANEHGEGLCAFVFATDDLARARHVLTRRGVQTSEVRSLRYELQAGRPAQEWKLLELDAQSTHGPRITVIERADTASRTQPHSADRSAIIGLDHVVVTTSHPERAAALYGARLGLEMKLDRTNPAWDSRLMFFRCGDLIVEVAHSLSKADPQTPDTLWGVSWRAQSIAATHTRLLGSGFDVSEIRTGRKPGTQVFTVRDAPAGVPTIVIGASTD